MFDEKKRRKKNIYIFFFHPTEKMTKNKYRDEERIYNCNYRVI